MLLLTLLFIDNNIRTSTRLSVIIEIFFKINLGLLKVDCTPQNLTSAKGVQT